MLVSATSFQARAYSSAESEVSLPQSSTKSRGDVSLALAVAGMSAWRAEPTELTQDRQERRASALATLTVAPPGARSSGDRVGRVDRRHVTARGMRTSRAPGMPAAISSERAGDGRGVLLAHQHQRRAVDPGEEGHRALPGEHPLHRPGHRHRVHAEEVVAPRTQVRGAAGILPGARPVHDRLHPTQHRARPEPARDPLQPAVAGRFAGARVPRRCRSGRARARAPDDAPPDAFRRTPPSTCPRSAPARCRACRSAPPRPRSACPCPAR